MLYLLVPIYLDRDLILIDAKRPCHHLLTYPADVYRLLPVTETRPIQNRKKGQDRLYRTTLVAFFYPRLRTFPRGLTATSHIL